MEERESMGSSVQMSLSLSGGDEGTPKFYAQPQRPLPDKDGADGETIRCRHPGT